MPPQASKAADKAYSQVNFPPGKKMKQEKKRKGEGGSRML